MKLAWACVLTLVLVGCGGEPEPKPDAPSSDSPGAPSPEAPSTPEPGRGQPEPPDPEPGQPEPVPLDSASEADPMDDIRQTPPPLLGFTMKGLEGGQTNLADYHGKVVMFVNVASRCGFTKQYAGLQELYEEYADRGLVVVGVPANNFGGQEPGTDQQIAEFCESRFGVTFPMLSKVSVKGEDQCELYRALVAAAEADGKGGEVKWNFEKFILGRDGRLVARFRSRVAPESEELRNAIESQL